MEMYRVEDGGTFVVIEGGVHIVGSDGIDAQGLHKCGVTQTERAIAQRVRAHSERLRASRLVSVSISALCSRFARTVRGNIRDTNDLEPIACHIVDEVRTLYLHILDAGHQRSEAGQNGKKGTGKHGFDNNTLLGGLPIMLYLVYLILGRILRETR